MNDPEISKPASDCLQENRYELLVLSRGDELKRYIRSLCRDQTTADDLFQEVSLLAVRKHHQLTDIVDLMAWLKAVARRKGQRLYSTKTREVLDDISLDQAMDGAPDSERDACARQLVGQVLEHLSESASEVILRRHVLGENASEIATQSGGSGASVRMKLKRALDSARTSLGDEESAR